MTEPLIGLAVPWQRDAGVARMLGVSGAWLKPFGDSRRNIRDDWTNEFLLDVLRPMQVMTGSERPGSRPAMQPGDPIVLHAVGHRRVFAAGRIVSGPAMRTDPGSRWSVDQWPWVYQCQIDVWVPFVSRGPLTWDLVPRVKGHISYGAPYSRIEPREHEALLAALRAAPGADSRPGAADDAARAARVTAIRKSGRRLPLPELDAALRQAAWAQRTPRGRRKPSS